MAGNPTIRTGRMTTFVVSIFSVLILVVLGMAQFIGLSQGTAFGLIESLAILMGAVALELEIFFEGKRQGLRNRDFSPMDIIGGVLGLGLIITGITSLFGAIVGTPIIGMPPVFQGISIMLGAGLLAQEIFSE